MTQSDLIARLEAAKQGIGQLEVIDLINEAIERLSPPLDGEYQIEGSVYEGMEAAISDGKRTIAHFPHYADAVELLAALTPPLDGEGVIQADRERAAESIDWEHGNDTYTREQGFRSGEADDHPLVQAFAAHRRAFTISTPREDEVERVAKALWFDSVDQQGYPNGQPTWDEMLAWPASDRNNRCEEFRSLARAALATLTPREQTQDD